MPAHRKTAFGHEVRPYWFPARDWCGDLALAANHPRPAGGLNVFDLVTDRMGRPRNNTRNGFQVSFGRDYLHTRLHHLANTVPLECVPTSAFAASTFIWPAGLI